MEEITLNLPWYVIKFITAIILATSADFYIVFGQVSQLCGVELIFQADLARLID